MSRLREARARKILTDKRARHHWLNARILASSLADVDILLEGRRVLSSTFAASLNPSARNKGDHFPASSNARHACVTKVALARTLTVCESQSNDTQIGGRLHLSLSMPSNESTQKRVCMLASAHTHTHMS